MFKKFASFYKPHMKIFITDLFCAIVVATVDLMFPMFSGKFIDDYIPNKNIKMIFSFNLMELS